MKDRPDLLLHLMELKSRVEETELLVRGALQEPPPGEAKGLGLEYGEAVGAAAHQLVAGYSSDFISINGEDGTYLFVSPGSRPLTGWSPSDLVGKNIYDFLHGQDVRGLADNGHDRQPTTIRMRCKDGSYRWVEVTSKLHMGPDGVRKVVSVMRDVSERERLLRKLEVANAQLTEMAATDELTGVANRRAFNERLKYLILEARRGRELSMILCDVDNFKMFNDRHGHPAGDEVLFIVAQKLQETCRKVDMVARYGGEEFAVLLPGTSSHGACILAERIRSMVSKIPSTYEQVTVSVGVCSYSQDVKSGKELLAGADRALYDAKNNGRNRIEVFVPGRSLKLVDDATGI